MGSDPIEGYYTIFPDFTGKNVHLSHTGFHKHHVQRRGKREAPGPVYKPGLKLLYCVPSAEKRPSKLAVRQPVARGLFRRAMDKARK